MQDVCDNKRAAQGQGEKAVESQKKVRARTMKGTYEKQKSWE
jgi:hypothetical protein